MTNQTIHVGHRQAESAFHAVRFANDNGRPFNLLVTVNFTDLGIDPDEASAFFREVRRRVARWYSYERKKNRPFGSFDDLYVHEHPDGGPRHVHWFVRAPDCARHELEAVIRARLQKLTTLDCLGSSLDFTDVEKAGGVAKYVLKGINPLYARYFHMRAVAQGVIIGRRISISQSVGRTARKAAGWTPKKATG